MKKFLIGIVASILVAGGLVAATGAVADAAPYPGTVKTKCQAEKGDPEHKKAKIKIRVTSDAGEPNGKIVVVFVNKKSGKATSFVARVDDGPKYTFAPLKKGTYAVSISFRPKDGSKWKPCSDSIDKLKVLG